MSLPRGLVAELPSVVVQGPRGLEVERDGMKAVVERVVGHVQAVMVAGPWAGQGPRMDKGLWQQVVEAAVEAVGGRVGVMVCVSAASTDETLARARWVGRWKAPGQIWVADLALMHHSNRGLPAHVEELGAASGRGVVLINDPEAVAAEARVGKRLNLLPQVVAKCARRSGLAGLVFRGELELGMRLGGAARAIRPAVVLYEGDELAFLRRPASQGLVSYSSVVLPEEWAVVVRHSLGLVEGVGGRGRVVAAAEVAGGLGRVLAMAPGPGVVAVLRRMEVVGAGAQAVVGDPAAEQAAVRWAERHLPC